MANIDRKIESPLIWEFYRYWRGLGGGGVPDRGLFDPSAVAKLMPSLHIVEMENGSDRLRYRLVGTQSDEFNGAPFTGRYLDEFFEGRTEAPARFFDTVYRRVGVTGQPEAGQYTWPSPRGTDVFIRFGVFPFAQDGTVRQFFYLEDLTDTFSAERREKWWCAALADFSDPGAG